MSLHDCLNKRAKPASRIPFSINICVRLFRQHSRMTCFKEVAVQRFINWFDTDEVSGLLQRTWQQVAAIKKEIINYLIAIPQQPKQGRWCSSNCLLIVFFPCILGHRLKSSSSSIYQLSFTWYGKIPRGWIGGNYCDSVLRVRMYLKPFYTVHTRDGRGC